MGTSSPHLPPGNRSQTQVICLAVSAFTCWVLPWLDSRVLEVEKISPMWYTTYCGQILFSVTEERTRRMPSFSLPLVTPLPLGTPSLTPLLKAHSKQNCNIQCGGHCFLMPPRALAGSVLLRPSAPALCGVCQLGCHPGCSSSHLPPSPCRLQPAHQCPAWGAQGGHLPLIPRQCCEDRSHQQHPANGATKYFIQA